MLVRNLAIGFDKPQKFVEVADLKAEYFPLKRRHMVATYLYHLKF